MASKSPPTRHQNPSPKKIASASRPKTSPFVGAVFSFSPQVMLAAQLGCRLRVLELVFLGKSPGRFGSGKEMEGPQGGGAVAEVARVIRRE